MIRRQLAAVFSAALLLIGLSLPSHAADKLTVLLDWFVNPDHAPLIVAKEAGYFEKAGLDITLVPPADPSAPPRLVAAGQGDIAISYQPNLYQHVAEDLPLVRFGTLVETPLNTLVVLADGPIKSIADLKGRKVGFSVAGFEDAVLGAMLKQAGLTMEDVELVNVNFALSPALLAGRVDAVIGAFRNFELTQLELEGSKGRAFYLEENGVPVYDELIYLAHRDRVNEDVMKRFIAATEAATIYLTNHPEESWKLFLKGHPDLDNELNRRAFADTLPRFAKRPAALDKGRYERFAQFMKDSGLIKEVRPLGEYAIELN